MTSSAFGVAVIGGVTLVGQGVAFAYQKGADIVLFSTTVDQRLIDQQLDQMAAMGVDHVAINHWWFQSNINSTTVAQDFTKYCASDDTIRQVIDSAHARGLAVQLRPIVDLASDPSHWRGQIVGGSGWFNNAGGYGDFIRHMADVAQEKSCEMFSVGVELEATQSQEANWRGLISSVRSHYSGQIVYGANWGNPAIGTPINWWDAVDFKGIDAYYPLTGVTNPTPAQLQSAWASRASQIASWHAANQPGKPILFTEVGYQAINGTNTNPPGVSGTVDMREQADCYEAMLSQVTGQSWFGGAYLWGSDPSPNPTAGDFDPFGKPAYDVMGSYYVPGYSIGPTWTGGANATWSNNANWSSGVAPTNYQAVTFNNAGGGNTNINLGGPVSVVRLVFDTSSCAAHTIQSGNTLTFNPGGGITITDTVTTSQTLNCDVALQGPAAFVKWSSSGTLIVNGGISAATSGMKRLALFGNGSFNLAGNISDGVGTLMLFKAGTGTLTLGGNNSYSGETVIASGNVKVTNNNALGATTGATIVQSGASLQLPGNSNVGAEPITITGDGSGGQGALQLLDNVAAGTFGGQITVAGNARVHNRSFNNGNALFNLTGKITGGGSGSTLQLWSSNSTPGHFRLFATGSDYVGTTTVLGGKVILAGGDNALSTNTVLNLDTSDRALSLDGGVLDLNGFNQQIAGLTNVSRSTVARVVNRGAGTMRTLTVSPAAGATFTYSGQLLDDTGKLALAKSGPGTQVITNAGNTFSEGTTVSAGTLSVTHHAALGTGTLTSSGGTVAFAGALAGAIKVRALNISGSGIVDISDNDMIVGSATSKQNVESFVASARNGGTWDGPFGLSSTTARANATHSTGLGVLSGAEFNTIGGGTGTFGGQTYAATDTLVKYTWNGDANFSGTVSFDDYVKIDTGFNTGLTGWANGDFNYSGAVSFDDYVLIDVAFNQQNGTLQRAIDWVSGDDRSDPVART